MPAITKVCGWCGSDDVKCDAWAVWSEEKQCWELGETFDHSHCNACEGECSIVDKPIEGEAPTPGAAGIDVVRTVGALGAGGAT